MSTAYQQSLAAYDNHALRPYAPSIALPRGAASAAVGASDARNAAALYARYPFQQSQPAQVPASQARNDALTQLHSAPSDRSTKSETPASAVSAQDAASSRKSPETLIYHSLQIPRCISSDGGSLADFAAQMTCLFWFEPIDRLKKAETFRSRPDTVTTQLANLSKPSEQFRKWVYNVLSTTQVTQNVILLALLFIYRLKLSTPQIKGREGSEYRLLTVALMLGNKFLDDNTYTNKTWAEVSCFAVGEIHVMEVEFLSNMRYNLLASKEEWEDWLTKLACFREYYTQASRAPASPLAATSPSSRGFHSPVVSPTTMLPTGDAAFSPATAPTYSPPLSKHAQDWATYHANPVSPLAVKPSTALRNSRKRSPDGEPMEGVNNPSKRVMRLHPAQVHENPWSTSCASAPRYGVPHLSIVTSQPTPNPYANQNVASLPPLQAGMRAMSTVYQPFKTTTTTTTTTMPQRTSGPPPMAYTTPSKRQHGLAGLASGYTSSPMAETPFGAVSGVHTPMALTPISHSPSVYLQQRASPYKPVRHVNRLLYPPPSASLDQYHLAVPVPPTHMHYQPLGRRNDLRTGVVPEFIVYNQGQQPLPHHAAQGSYAP
ncbi:uncharacterized protein TRIREDRAFT_76249 [Trichoderma reesei QM6a]|uniref:Predicted protein n=2 Tax=Hypocrea jecorina TaxID=51453 RepID=G0RF95_HYPJQ|nr:uncharacterized protein TRIREDRAFT_76249 [Trichoderma reesei QM6a]EGR50100.1 predicted protein [Trichoderma reesei QM6a]ETS03660.1 hypothetical protein M419DRAFT_96783 [Trichoderma reesei RUT C-30]